MIRDIARLLSDQRNKYIVNIESAKQAISIKFRSRVFHDVFAYVTSFALYRVLNQYKKINAEKSKDCINSFITIFELLYVYKI